LGKNTWKTFGYYASGVFSYALANRN